VSTQDFVRAARESDAADVARIQVDCWRHGYTGLIPDAVLAELTSDDALGQWCERWTEAIGKPPTSRHRVLVATHDRAAVGFASMGPAGDADRWPATDAELYELRVAPGLTRQGHGGRLLSPITWRRTASPRCPPGCWKPIRTRGVSWKPRAGPPTARGVSWTWAFASLSCGCM